MRFLLFPCLLLLLVVGFLHYWAGSDADARPALQPEPIGGSCGPCCVQGHVDPVDSGGGGTPAYPG